jgi:DNA repair exonuclease SbcCD ATPase subunit
MDPRKRVITELNRRIAELSAQALTQIERLGDYLANQDAGSFADTAFLETHRHILELRRRLPSSRQQVRRIMQCVEKNAELENKIKAAAERFAEVEGENESLCEEIGRGVYAALGDSSSEHKEELDRLFAKVNRQERELQALMEDQERNRTSIRTGNILKIIGEAGRSFFIRSAVSFKQKAVARAYADAGRQLCESPLAESLGEATLRRLIAPYRNNKKKLEDLAREGEGLRKQQSEVWVELRGLGAEKSHQRRVNEIERQIQKTEKDLQESCRRLGELFRANPVRSFITEPEVKKRLAKLAQAEKDGERHRKQIRRVEAAMQIDALDAQTRAMREKIEKLTREIRSRQQEVRALERRIGEADSEKERLAKVRGSEHTFLQLDEKEEEEGE